MLWRGLAEVCRKARAAGSGSALRQRRCCALGYRKVKTGGSADTGGNRGYRIAQRIGCVAIARIAIVRASQVNESTGLVDVRDRVYQRVLPGREQRYRKQYPQGTRKAHGIT